MKKGELIKTSSNTSLMLILNEAQNALELGFSVKIDKYADIYMLNIYK